MNDRWKAQRAEFRRLHQQGCFLLPNPWDVGSARRLQRMGFVALATSSAGAAAAIGRDDGELSRDEVLAHLQAICEATALPVNADFESGFAATAKEVGANVALAVATGVSGLSIEDRIGDGLYELPAALERIRAAREAIDRTGEDVILVARSEGFLVGETDPHATLERLAAYSDAGADCLYAPGVRDTQMIARIVRTVAPKPVNVLLLPGMSVREIESAGVRRISVGSALAAAAWEGFQHAAEQFLKQGTVPQRNKGA